VLAAEHRAVLCHLGLDERVADPGAHWHAAGGRDDLRHGTGRDHVVDDRRARLAGQLPGRDQRGEYRGRDGLAALVHHEAPIGVAVEGQPYVGVVLEHRALQVAQVLRLDGVGLVVRERAVQLEVERDHRDGQPLEDLRYGVPGHPVTGVHGHGERPDRGDVDQLPQVLRVAGQQVHGSDRARDGSWRQAPFGQISYVFKTCLDADRPGPGAAQFDAVVPGRVVAGRDHRARDAEVAAAEVEHVGRAEARGQHIGALARRAPAERGGERGRGGAHVVDGQDRRGPGQLRERRADRLRHALVKLVRDDAPDVIGLDDAREITHYRTRLPFAAGADWVSAGLT
jgi:hypothetical protein